MYLKLKRHVKVLLFALLGVAVLWLITRNQDVERIWKEFTEANFLWVLLSILAGILSHWVRALRWKLLINSLGHHPKTSTIFYAQMTGYLANLVVPRLGEITRCGTLASYSRAPFNALVGTVVAERVFDMIWLLVLIFITVIFQLSLLNDFLSTYIFNPLLATLEGYMWVILPAGLLALALMLYLLKTFREVSPHRQGLRAKVKRHLIGFWKGVVSLLHVKNRTLFLVYSVVIWTLYFFTVYFCFFALEATSVLGVVDGFTVLALGSLGIVAPVPGGVGTYHFIVITTLNELFGIVRESATSYAYIAHASQMVIIVLLGVISWIMLSLKIKNINPHDQEETEAEEL